MKKSQQPSPWTADVITDIENLIRAGAAAMNGQSQLEQVKQTTDRAIELIALIRTLKAD